MKLVSESLECGFSIDSEGSLCETIVATECYGLNKAACIAVDNIACYFADDICSSTTDVALTLTCDQDLSRLGCLGILNALETCRWNVKCVKFTVDGDSTCATVSGAY
jgi:hypothetical protein